MIKYLFAVIVLAALLTGMQTARADEGHKTGGLYCDDSSNRFFVRFGFGADNYQAIRSQDEDLFKKMTFHNDGICTLQNRKTLRLGIQNAQAFPYGVGGGDPDASFILTSDTRPVYYGRNFYEGYGRERFPISYVFYDGIKLYECGITGDPNLNQVIACKDESRRLSFGQTQLIREEQEAQNKDEARLRTAEMSSPFCKTFDHMHKYSLKNGGTFIANDMSGGLISRLPDIDIDNDGRKDKVIRVGGSEDDCPACGTQALDGSYLIAFTRSSAQLDGFLKEIETRPLHDQIETMGGTPTKELKSSGGTLISVGDAQSSLRYVYNVPINYDNKNYIYSFETRTDKTPSRRLSQMDSQQRVNTVCQYP